jgi:hypothetical protein
VHNLKVKQRFSGRILQINAFCLIRILKLITSYWRHSKNYRTKEGRVFWMSNSKIVPSFGHVYKNKSILLRTYIKTNRTLFGTCHLLSSEKSRIFMGAWFTNYPNVFRSYIKYKSNIPVRQLTNKCKCVKTFFENYSQKRGSYFYARIAKLSHLFQNIL